MADRIYWHELEETFSNHEDTIRTTMRDTTPGYTEFRLQTWRPMWWKGLLIRERDEGDIVASCLTQDQDQVSPVVSIVSAQIERSWHLVFSKAKFLGVHTDMYKLPIIELNRGAYQGKRFVFMWERD